MTDKRKRIIKILTVIALIAVFVVLVRYERVNRYVSPENFDDYLIDIHYIDVGQGDSTLIVTPDENILIDAGLEQSAVALTAYLDKAGVDTIDYLVITHPHSDHIGGASKLLDSFDVDTIVFNGCGEDNSYVKKLRHKAKIKNTCMVTWTAGDIINVGQAVFYVLAPLEESNDGENNSSLVIKMEYGETSFLFTGDAEYECEKEMLESYESSMLDCDVLKIGHHGSSTSTTVTFVEAVTPVLSVISCEQGNAYGHPYIETLKTLENAKSAVWRTDLCGSLVLRTDGDSIIILEALQ